MNKISDNAYVMDLSNNMAMSKKFNVADLYTYHPTKQLYPEYNLEDEFFWRGRDWCKSRGNEEADTIIYTY